MARKTINVIVLSLGIALLCLGSIPCGAESAESGGNEEELFLIAQKAFDDGFYDVAIRYIDQYLAEYPQTRRSVQAQLLLGQCYFFKKQYLKAYDIFQGLLKTDAFKDATLFWVGETYFKGADYKQARKYYQQLLRDYPDSPYQPQARYSLGWTYFEEGNYESAGKIFWEFVETFPDHALSEDAAFKLGECEYNAGRPEMASQYFRHYILKYPDSPRQAKAYFYIAETHYYLEDYPAAITYYAQVAEMTDDPKLKLLADISLGWSYLKLEKYDLAEQYFETAETLSAKFNIPSDDIYLGKATLFVAMKEHKKALKAYQELIERFPNSPRIDEAQLGKANMHYFLGEYDQALKAYRGVIDTYQNKEGFALTLEKAFYGMAWTSLKSGEVETAVGYFKDILNRTTSDIVKASVLTQIGDAYQDTDNLTRALEFYDQVLTDYPDSHYTDYAQFRQGIALLKLNKIEAAMLSFQSLQTNFPGSKYLNDVNYYLGLANYKKENWRQAAHYLTAYLKGAPQRPDFVSESRYLRALAMFYLEDFEEALELFQDLIRVEKDNPLVVPVALYHVARCLHHLDRDKEAVKMMLSLADTYPTTDAAQDALLWLGDHYLAASKPKEAISYYQQYLEKFPSGKHVDLIRYELAQAYQIDGKLDRALNFFKLLDKKSDPEIYAKARLAIADIFSQQVDSQEAIDTYQDIVTTVPDFRRDAYLKIARIQEKNKRYAPALESYLKALESPKGLSRITDAELRFYVADAHELLNDPQEAVDAYLKIPYLNPEATSWVIKAYLRAARIFENDSKWEKASTIYKKILAFKTDEAKYAQERLDWIKENLSP